MATAKKTTAPRAPQPEPEPVPRWVRVRDRVGAGHEYDVAGAAFDPEMHSRVNKPAQYPDLFGDTAMSRPTTYRTDKAGQPVDPQKEN